MSPFRGDGNTYILRKFLHSRHVRFGSLADICSAKRHVRSYSKSGHVQRNSACPLCANRDIASIVTVHEPTARRKTTLISANSPGCVSTFD